MAVYDWMEGDMSQESPLINSLCGRKVPLPDYLPWLTVPTSIPKVWTTHSTWNNNVLD